MFVVSSSWTTVRSSTPSTSALSRALVKTLSIDEACYGWFQGCYKLGERETLLAEVVVLHNQGNILYRFPSLQRIASQCSKISSTKRAMVGGLGDLCDTAAFPAVVVVLAGSWWITEKSQDLFPALQGMYILYVMLLFVKWHRDSLNSDFVLLTPVELVPV
ncbi:hypothetical protein Tco_1045095 [Tanacetum coccineum]|uniref:Uncharacterized protein n=1 Tax=Tanacetum coccineum TaxID=301880 RepID=A0ABQ5GSL4_9ASTR